jgi:chromosome partitioning protein
VEKGGSCKTTNSINTGIALSKLGYKVLLIDNDPQSHLSVSFGIDVDNLPLTLTGLLSTIIDGKDLIKELVESAIISTNGVDILPSSYNMMNIEYALKASIGGEFALLEIVKLIRDSYDVVIIDCPSSTNIFTINALIASQFVVIPILPHFLSVNGLQMIIHTISQVQKKYNENLQIAGVLVSMAQKNTNGFKGIMEELNKVYSTYVNIFETVIPQSVAVSTAPKNGQSV